MEKTLLRKIIGNFIIVGMIVGVILTTMLYVHERNAAEEDVDFMLEQVQKSYVKSEDRMWEKRSDYASDYLSHAEMIDYVLDMNPEVRTTMGLLEMKTIFGSENIFLLDKQGTVILSSDKSTEGKSLLDNEAAESFRELAAGDDPDGKMVVFRCGEIIEGVKNTEFVALKPRTEGYAMLLLGIDNRALKEIETDVSIAEVLEKIPMSMDTEVYMLDKESGDVLGATGEKDALMKISGVESQTDLLDFVNVCKSGKVVEIAGSYKYIKSKVADDVILVGYMKHEGYMDQVINQILITVAVLLCSILFLSFMVKKYFRNYILAEFEKIEATVKEMLEGNEEARFRMGEISGMKGVETILNDWNEQMSNNLKNARQASETDGLTGLYNRTGFETKAEETQRVHPNRGAMIMIDVDNFKSINDNLGHPEGDKVLKIIGEAIRSQFRENDIVGRLGGDEFAIYMKNRILFEELEEKVQEMMTAVKHSLVDYWDEHQVSISVGAACVQDRDARYADLYKYADMALYEAKKGGKNTYMMRKI